MVKSFILQIMHLVSFTLTKQGSQWIGNHVCYNYTAKFDKYNHNNQTEIGWIYLEQSEYNKYLLKLAEWTTRNPLELAYNAKTLTFNCDKMTSIQFGEANGKWYMSFIEDYDAEFEDPPVKDLRITFNYNNLRINELSITCKQEGYEIEDALYNPIANYIEQLKVDCFVHNVYPTIEHSNGLMIFMHKDYISTTTTDLKYQTGTNTFV